jgi:hypothetical protein
MFAKSEDDEFPSFQLDRGFAISGASSGIGFAFAFETFRR